MDKAIKILFLAANPDDSSQLKLDQEMRSIDQALRQTDFRDKFDIKQHWAVRVVDLQGYLLRHKPDIVHLSGHGSASSEIILEDINGNSQPVSIRALSQLFSILRDNIRCVILNACYSEHQALAIAQTIDCVIGMSKAIGDSAAISFAAAFYQAIGYGIDIKTAFDLGCLQIDFESLDEQNTPTLIAINCDPREIVFVQSKRANERKLDYKRNKEVIKRKLPNRNENLPDTIDWDALIDDLRHQRLVPFLGAGASLANNESNGLPSSSELAKFLAEKCGYPGKDCDDLLHVAQFFALKRGEIRLRELVKEKFSHPNIKPSEVHQILAGWPIEVVLTTNFDNLMERAFVINDKDPVKAIYNRIGNQEQINSDPSIYAPLVYKLHGSVENLDSMVITEDNYVDFLISLIEGNPEIPDTISKIFRTCSILFVGYGLKDWNIRVLLRYLRKTDIRSFAVQRNLEATTDAQTAREWESTVLYWEHKKLSIYNCDALEFLSELNHLYQEEVASV